MSTHKACKDEWPLCSNMLVFNATSDVALHCPSFPHNMKIVENFNELIIPSLIIINDCTCPLSSDIIESGFYLVIFRGSLTFWVNFMQWYLVPGQTIWLEKLFLTFIAFVEPFFVVNLPHVCLQREWLFTSDTLVTGMMWCTATFTEFRSGEPRSLATPFNIHEKDNNLIHALFLWLYVMLCIITRQLFNATTH